MCLVDRLKASISSLTDKNIPEAIRTAELGEVFQNDKLNSTIMTREEYKKRSVWRRFVGWFAHLFTPVI
jgi:hypothetical protein